MSESVAVRMVKQQLAHLTEAITGLQALERRL